MTPPLESTWATRDEPILRESLRRLDAGEDCPDLHDIRRELGLEPNQMDAGLRALESAFPPYIDVEWAGLFVRAVSERARRELGTWPSAETVVDRLAAALSEAADAEEEPERKGRTRAVADAIGGYLRDLSVQAIGTQIGGGGPL